MFKHIAFSQLCQSDQHVGYLICLFLALACTSTYSLTIVLITTTSECNDLSLSNCTILSNYVLDSLSRDYSEALCITDRTDIAVIRELLRENLCAKKIPSIIDLLQALKAHRGDPGKIGMVFIKSVTVHMADGLSNAFVVPVERIYKSAHDRNRGHLGRRTHYSRVRNYYNNY